MPTLLLELFSEEIPSRMQRGGAEQLQRLMLAGFEKHGLKPGEVKTFVSPRHLAIQCFGLPAVQPDTREERRGPKIGAPEQALKGFLGSTGLTLEQCEQRDGYYYATIERKGRAVAEVVKEICESALAAFVWPKSMKWGARPMQWVRPLHKITCLLDDAVVPVQFGHLTASNITHGHRFLAPGEITIPHAEKYESLLADAKVMVDFAKRREAIAQGIAKVAAEAKLALHADDGLLDEVTGLVEHPVPLLCEFDAKFLDLPPEVLISEMKNHQRYFALYGADGKLTNRFITVANMVNADGGARVKDGNGRVVRARLADGEFYWEQDRKVKLEDWGKKLSDVVFHAKVGMMDAKVARIEKLAVEIAKAVGFADETSVRRAAQLCKADLTSGMVGEFPELQGIMGRYYARHQGESDNVAEAIYEHYKPLGASDGVPESELGAIISVADKLDSITSLFAAGEKPTGSKDPLALRRAALGVLRIIKSHKFRISLLSLMFQAFPAKPEEKERHEIRQQVLSFIEERLKVTLREEGVRHDIIDASLTWTIQQMLEMSPKVRNNDFDVVMQSNKAHALQQILSGDTGLSILAAYKRASNLLLAEEKKDTAFYEFDKVESKLLKQPEEVDLYAALLKAKNKIEPLMENQAFAEVGEAVGELRNPLDSFFAAILVNAPEKDIRANRLCLLALIRDTMNRIADFSKIEG